jgi:hypothetical protein
MPVILIILGLIALGVILELVRRHLPIDATILWVIRAFIIAVVVVLILKVLGVWDALWAVRI